MYVHLINDEKFLPPFIKRAKAVQDNNLYIVFGAKPPFTFLQESEQIIHSSEWTDYQLKHKVKIERVYVHLMTYQKIKWVRAAPKTPVYWLFYGNDLYELLMAFKGFKLYEKLDRRKGILTRIKGKNLLIRLKRWAELKVYSLDYEAFVRYHVDYWCFWSPGDFDLLVEHYKFQGKMLKFQYGAFNPEDIELIKQWVNDNPNFSSEDILLNHSGSQSGNHKHLLAQLHDLGVTQPVKTPLSYGNQEHIKATLEFGKRLLGLDFHPILNYMDRKAYFELIYNSGYVIFGHRRQEAGNTLFIALMSGTKVFLHPESVLLPFLKEQGYHFFTWNDLSKESLAAPLSKTERKNNYSLACRQFSEQTITENYQRILK
ncbi:MAG: hypothetical protein VXY91_06385 [Bacteroidota bacterium]|nr:hypothetical protein [Bacteroidota bacterium]